MNPSNPHAPSEYQSTQRARMESLKAACDAARTIQDSQAFEPIEAARTQLQAAYQQHMGELMTGLVQTGSPIEHHELLAMAQRCLERFESLSEWLAAQEAAAALPATTQSSAA